MENTEEIFHFLEDFSKRKPKTIPQELNEYLAYVARTGDPVYQWPLVKCLFKEKLLNVITDFYETTPGIDIPSYPNVDPFHYDIMKNSLLERLDAFTSAPFTVQRICELLTFPRKQYNRIDKFMRAIEKNILVVSTREPGAQRHVEPEHGEAEPVVNGSDNNSEYNVDVEMEDMSWKENAEQSSEPQPSSSDTHISVDDIEARLQAKQNTPMETQDKTPTEYESVTPPELNVASDDPAPENKTSDLPPIPEVPAPAAETIDKPDPGNIATVPDEPKTEVEMRADISESPALVIPEITVDDAEMTEQKLIEQANVSEKKEEVTEKPAPEEKAVEEPATEQPVSTDESSSDSTMKEEEPKHISEVSTSSEESSSSSDNTDGNSNSPKTDESNTDTVQDESNQETIKVEEAVKEEVKEPEIAPSEDKKAEPIILAEPVIESDNYSISDISSGFPEPTAESPSKTEKTEEAPSEVKEEKEPVEEQKEEAKAESIENDPPGDS